MWNYRIMRHKDPGGDYYALHEVYYDEDQAHKPVNWTKDPAGVMSETAKGIIEVLRMMLKDAEASVMEYGREEDSRMPAEPGCVQEEGTRGGPEDQGAGKSATAS